MEHGVWLVGFVLLTGVDLVAWRRRDARVRWAWSLWIVPSCLALYGLGWALDVLALSKGTFAAFLGMIVAAVLGAPTSLVTAFRSRGGARSLAAVNALALCALTVRVLVLFHHIRLM